jgi:hypothetical protein
MLPDFLVGETVVRESGQSAVFDLWSDHSHDLLVTFGITHAVEKESIGVAIYASHDGAEWPVKPLASFAPKSYCGTYDLTLATRGTRYLKAVWSVKRWSRDESRPFFRIFVSVRSARMKTLTAGAA